MLNPEYKWMAFLEFGAASHPNFALFPNHSMWVFMLDKQIGLNNMYLVVSRMPVDAKGEITDDIRQSAVACSKLVGSKSPENLASLIYTPNQKALAGVFVAFNNEMVTSSQFPPDLEADEK